MIDVVLAWIAFVNLVVVLPLILWLGRRSERPISRAQLEARMMAEARDGFGFRLDRRERNRYEGRK